MDLGELVGLMLGAQPASAAARIVVERSGQRVDGYRVTVARGTDWVVVRDGGLTHRVSRRGTTIERNGAVVETGPPKLGTSRRDRHQASPGSRVSLSASGVAP